MVEFRVVLDVSPELERLLRGLLDAWAARPPPSPVARGDAAQVDAASDSAAVPAVPVDRPQAEVDGGAAPRGADAVPSAEQLPRMDFSWAAGPSPRKSAQWTRERQEKCAELIARGCKPKAIFAVLLAMPGAPLNMKSVQNQFYRRRAMTPGMGITSAPPPGVVAGPDGGPSGYWPWPWTVERDRIMVDMLRENASSAEIWRALSQTQGPPFKRRTMDYRLRVLKREFLGSAPPVDLDVPATVAPDPGPSAAPLVAVVEPEPVDADPAPPVEVALPPGDIAPPEPKEAPVPAKSAPVSVLKPFISDLVQPNGVDSTAALPPPAEPPPRSGVRLTDVEAWCRNAGVPFRGVFAANLERARRQLPLFHVEGVSA